MPDPPLTPPRRHVLPVEGDPPPPAPFVELGLASCFSFLRGASEAAALVETARSLGYDALGIADANTMAGVVRLHTESESARLRPIIGCRIETVEGLAFLAYPQDRAAYGRLCRLISAGRMSTLDGEWQAKGVCDIDLALLAAHAEGVHLILIPPTVLDQVLTVETESNIYAFPAGEGAPAPQSVHSLSQPFTEVLPRLVHRLPTLRHIAASYLYVGDDIARIERLDALARANGLSLLATNDVLYATPDRRPLQDVMTAIRHKTTVAAAGHLLEPNAERHLKSPEEMVRLFQRWPHAIKAARDVADTCCFNLSELRYEYPEEICPDGHDPQSWLEDRTWAGATEFYGGDVPEAVADTLRRELALIGKLNLATYFLTIKDIVDFARNCDPPILCQGRGSAANSAVCFCLGITSVDPAKHALLFDRFISEERKEPPDIDVDFEHERREEVIQYIYRRYSRERAGLCATVIHYRPRMAIREVGKAMGLSEDVTSALARTVWGSWGSEVGERNVTESGLDGTDPHLKRVVKLAEQMIGMPRHLSQHVGGFILTQGPLVETIPIGNGAMADRSFIEWDKDDIDALGILKVDVLALGMLTCIRKCLDLLGEHHGRTLTLATVPREDPAVYDMLCKGDSLGVFQVESRAQMNMLPRLRPRCFYDLVIEVAIVRPGPIQGDMVHPYLKRRRGEEKVEIPAPGPEHGPPDELSSILARTLGVPIFQEQAMKIALDAAKFSSLEANRLRKAMATFRSRGMVHELEDMMVGRMVQRGYDPDFAARCFNQIKGFGEYGFPESHAASFAHLVYVSSWLKCHYPAAFACALLNSQPMGFYAPAQIVRDAAQHGVVVLPVDVNHSHWDCTLEDVDSRRGAEARRGLDSRGDAETRRKEEEGEEPAAQPLSSPSFFSASPRLRVNPETQPLCASAPLREPQLALRLGLRQIDGFPEHAAAMLVAARSEDGPFTDAASLKDRAGLSPTLIERLAAADALGSLGLSRRQALWDARSLIAPKELPLFAAMTARSQGEERHRAVLPMMPLSEEVVADYQTHRLSLKAHPMAFLRPMLGDRGFVRAADLRNHKYRATVQVAGVVLVRQRPGSAKGVCFITLEDETGVVNLVIWPDLLEKQRKVIMGARLMEVRGRVEYDDEVIHVIATHLTDASASLDALSDADRLVPPIARADECNRPIPERTGFRQGGFSQAGPGARTHPRDVRIIPKSRDFH
ncbi:MAG: error-prone DNA polymerase [Novosphingobium sp. 28-62-57]|uniref:error-prone DNA polymerase n=1 Tax=unclassified Novosphingobium TaxID=2644732 RepID=UPI000BCAE9EB|nr:MULTISPECIES: error-prone DNA polymerase [unclassified Novosphingobium]OYW49653.1 MAG: error-prone DNA polymerase [Novosphingobium sp. 12-62-10]OYZ12390.1 MAG: error-prone DNA polymerase [Novosphingobium sp. 28-62-57]OZA36047.1 MAG: error-prone DNA polymerase [Novosphingobium sp. 17-62-9]HQS69578.1 error-prone DNA polymerase [Novosphingobium sp.]